MVNLKRKILLITIAILLFAASLSFAVDPRFFKGYVFVNGSLGQSGTVVQVYLNNASTATNGVILGQGNLNTTPEGWYTISFEAETGDNVTFKINGVPPIEANGTNTTAQPITVGLLVVENFNLSVNKSNTGSSCTYSSGCTSGFCVDGYCCNTACSGACNLCNVAGALGTCTDSNAQCAGTTSACYCSGGSCVACSSGYTCSSNSCSLISSGGGGGGGGGGGAVVDEEDTQTVDSIKTSAPASFKIDEDKVDDLKVEEVELEVNVEVSNASLTVKESSKPSGANIAISEDSGLVYKYLDITTNVPNTAISKAKIKFRVSKSWVDDNDIDKNTVVLKRYVDDDWASLETTMLREDDNYYYFEAATTGFSTFAVTGQKLSGFWAIVDQIDSYYAGEDVDFWDIIGLIDAYYGA